MRIDSNRMTISYNLMVNINFPDNAYKSGKFVGDFILEDISNNGNGKAQIKSELK